jgi:hypothetical protein
MQLLQPGDQVKMNKECVEAFCKDCGLTGNHITEPTDDDPIGDCFNCSRAHVLEFMNCIGVVIELTNYNNGAESDPNKIGPEYDVRWQPSNLRYCYDPKHLEKI